MQWQPHDYQKRALAFALQKKRCALWMEMGLGKTVVAGTWISELLDTGEAARALVVAPVRVMTQTWPDELQRWDHLQWLRWRMLTGSAKKRHALVDAPSYRTDVDFISYDCLAALVEHLRRNRWRRLPWQVLVFDESSLIKSARTKRWRAARALASRMEFLLQLTGTPSPNGLLDVWAPFNLIDEEGALGSSFSAYRQRWFESDYMGWKYEPRPKAEAQIHEAVRPRAVSMRERDYLDLEAPLVVKRDCEMPPRCLDQYMTLQAEMEVQLQTDNVVAANAGVLLGKCLQFTNGALYTNGGSATWEEVHTVKLDVLDEVVEENGGEPILVPYLFKSDVVRISHRYPKAQRLDTAGTQAAAWNRGEIAMLLLHPRSYGLNLQFGGRVLCWFGVPWSLGNYQQTNKRLHRQGQPRPVRIYHILCRDTVDQQVMAALDQKRRVQDVLLENLKLR